MTPLSDTRSVGVGGLLVVLAAVLLATTFLPALLAVLGRNIDRPKWLARPPPRFHAPTGWAPRARRLWPPPRRAGAVGPGAAPPPRLPPPPRRPCPLPPDPVPP